ncbi:MAG: DUF664 domain-containing protein [Gemmataceae bacterium]
MTTPCLEALKQSLVGQLEELCQAIRTASAPLSAEQFWRRPLQPGNSIGHLVLHLAGNLNHRAGARLGNTGYVRDREREFTETIVPSPAEALAQLEAAVAVYRQVVESLDAEQLTAAHPDAPMGSNLNALVKMLVHFAVHRGQISYLVRLVG